MRTRGARPLGIALLLLLACGAGCARESEPDPRPNLILFVIDTLRADRLGSYGNSRAATPHLDAFAGEALLFEHAHAPAPRTLPSHASLFTSTYPATHGVWNQLADASGKPVHPRLADASITLAEVLRDAGYATAGVADGGWLTRVRGMDQGFETFDSDHLGAANRIDRAIEWLEERDEDRPFFLFLHTYEVHVPYFPPAGYEDEFTGDYAGPLRDTLAAARRAAGSDGVDSLAIYRAFFKPLVAEGALDREDARFLLALYDAELKFVDEQFARLVSYLRDRDLLDRTLVVVTSDHGEEFDEHGRWGHHQTFGESIRIPLLVRAPAGPRGVRRRDPVDLVDLMPSILATLGVEAPATVQGRRIDLESGEDGGLPPRALIAEIPAPESQISVREGGMTAILGAAGGAVFASDDPGETRDLASTAEGAAFLEHARELSARHHERAARVRAEHGLAPAIEVLPGFDPAEAEALRALGYLAE